MKERINKKCANLITDNADFRAFVEQMEKYSTEEIIALYGLDNDIIFYCSGLSKMPA